MKIRSRQLVLTILLGVAALLAAIIVVLAVNPRAYAQAHAGGFEAPQAGPPACACARQTSLAGDGQITNCQCGALQCVVAIGAKMGTSQTPALVCVK